MALHDVGDLVPEKAGQHVVVEVELEHPPGEEDLSAGEGEGVRLRHVDEVEGEGKLLESRLAGDVVADVVDPEELLGVVVVAVLRQRLLGGAQALGEQIRIRHLLGRQGHSAENERCDEGKCEGSHSYRENVAGPVPATRHTAPWAPIVPQTLW